MTAPFFLRMSRRGPFSVPPAQNGRKGESRAGSPRPSGERALTLPRRSQLNGTKRILTAMAQPRISPPIMNTKIRFALCALALLVPGRFPAWAADPVTPLKAGRVLVLENARILEGDIERVGDQYRIRRTIGETWLPADKAQCLCADLEEA